MDRFPRAAVDAPKSDRLLANVAWTQVAVILLVILSTVIVGDRVSAKIRHAII